MDSRKREVSNTVIFLMTCVSFRVKTYSVCAVFVEELGLWICLRGNVWPPALAAVDSKAGLLSQTLTVVRFESESSG